MARPDWARGVRGARPARGARRPGPGAGGERLPLGGLPPRAARERAADGLRPGPVEAAARPDAARGRTGRGRGSPRLARRTRARAIRRFRDREIFRADLRSILGLSRGPGAVLGRAVRRRRGAAPGGLRDRAARRLEPLLAPGRRRPCLPRSLCALGKFGGRELGFASDLELMLVYDDRQARRATPGSPRRRLLRPLVAALQRRARRPRGPTFDLDFRLRPYGRAGVAGHVAFGVRSTITAPAGPAWGYERQALIKLRVDRRRPGAGARGRGASATGSSTAPSPSTSRAAAGSAGSRSSSSFSPARSTPSSAPGRWSTSSTSCRRCRSRHGGARRDPADAQHPPGPRGPRRAGRAGRRRTSHGSAVELPLLPHADRRPARGPRPRQGPGLTPLRVGRIHPALPPDAAAGAPRRSGPSSSRGSPPRAR